MAENGNMDLVDGLLVKKPGSNVPDFIKFNISIKREELIKWLQGQEGEWINAQVKESKGGKYYAAVDNWKPNENQEAPQMKSGNFDSVPETDDLQF